MADNAVRIEAAKQNGTLPYFLKDNKAFSQEFSNKYGYTGLRLGRHATRQEKQSLQSHVEFHNYSIEQNKNFIDIERETNFKRTRPMSFEEADNGKANLSNDKDNCAACVLAHELRLRGYDITALPYDGENFAALSKDTRLIWITKKGKEPSWSANASGTEKDIISKIEKATQIIGSRYHLGWDITEDYGHIITIVRTKERLIFYDPQRNEYCNLIDIIKEMLPNSKLQLLRVDNLLVRPNLLKSFTKQIS